MTDGRIGMQRWCADSWVTGDINISGSTVSCHVISGKIKVE